MKFYSLLYKIDNWSLQNPPIHINQLISHRQIKERKRRETTRKEESTGYRSKSQRTITKARHEIRPCAPTFVRDGDERSIRSVRHGGSGCHWNRSIALFLSGVDLALSIRASAARLPYLGSFTAKQTGVLCRRPMIRRVRGGKITCAASRLPSKGSAWRDTDCSNDTHRMIGNVL